MFHRDGVSRAKRTRHFIASKAVVTANDIHYISVLIRVFRDRPCFPFSFFDAASGDVTYTFFFSLAPKPTTFSGAYLESQNVVRSGVHCSAYVEPSSLHKGNNT